MGEQTSNSIANLPIIDLLSPDRFSTAATLRQACIEVGFFYIVNHGVEKDLFGRLFEESKKFFSLPLEEKMKLDRKEFRGYTALYSEKLDTSLNNKGDSKESFYIGPLHDEVCNLNQWPSEELFPNWRPTVEAYQRQVLNAGKSLLSLLALALNLDEKFFENVGAMNQPMPFLRLLHYPEGDDSCHNDEVFLGASAHSDYGMITLLASDGVPGLQVCRERDHQPHIWEDVPHVEGAMIVNIGDILERWTNCLFRSTLHRVLPKGRERYSAALFLDPPHDFLVECLETCCSESNPPRFPPICYSDYLQGRYRVTYGA